MPEIIRVPLGKGQYALVDADDVGIVNRHRWHVFAPKDRRTQYAVTSAWEDGKQRTLRMHRLILGAQPGELVDHINGDGLDNRRVNLRLCNAAENSRSLHVRRGGTSKYHGVASSGSGYPTKPWSVTIQVNRRTIRVGRFRDEEEAARAYDAAARNYHGEFATLNFPGEDSLVAESYKPVSGILIARDPQIGKGRSRVKVRCGGCGTESWFYVWSFAGHGKAQCESCGRWIDYAQTMTEKGG